VIVSHAENWDKERSPRSLYNVEPIEMGRRGLGPVTNREAGPLTMGICQLSYGQRVFVTWGEMPGIVNPKLI